MRRKFILPKVIVRHRFGRRIQHLFSFGVLLCILGCGGGGGGNGSSNLSSLLLAGPNESSVGDGPGKASFVWDAPTTNTDGSALSDLAGFRLYYGTSSPLDISSSKMIDVGNTTSYTITGLDPAPHYFAVTSYSFAGIESRFSNEVSK